MTGKVDRLWAGDGFRAGTKSETAEVILRLDAAAAHRIGYFIMRSLPKGTSVEDERFEIAAAILNLAEYVDESLIGLSGQ